MEKTSNKALSFVRTYTLSAQTPLIHFQYEQPGATLRATEVKPKLDKFLKEKAKKDGADLSGCFVGDTDALDYKMRIVSDGKARIVSLGFKDENGQKTEYDIYYGNMGNNSQKKKGVSGNAKITIACLKSGLLEFIDKYIGEFFAVTNFGTMSNKGFGSFIVSEKKLSEAQVSVALKERYGASRCYCINSQGTHFKQIKVIYSILKSGVNFHGYQRSLLFLFMHNEYDYGNEKAWLKQQRIAPALGRNADQHDKVSYFVRALLGVGERIEFLNDLNNRRDKVVVTISDSNKQIERLPSPIIFKVIGNSIYMVANRIDENIYGKTFTFESKMGKGTLKVPTKAELGEDFIDKFLAFAVGEFQKGIADKFVSSDNDNRNSRIIIKEV